MPGYDLLVDIGMPTKSEIAISRGRNAAGRFESAGYDAYLVMRHVLEELANDRFPTAICAENGMPSHSTIHAWLRADDDLRRQYELARRPQSDYLADRIQDIADAALAGATSPAAARAASLSLMWRARVLNPARYGDQKTVTHEFGSSVRERPERAQKRIGHVRPRAAGTS